MVKAKWHQGGCSPNWLMIAIHICYAGFAACPNTAGETGGWRACRGNEAGIEDHGGGQREIAGTDIRTRWRIWKAWGRKARRCCASTKADTPVTGWKAARCGAATSRRTNCLWRASGRSAVRFRHCMGLCRRSSARNFRGWRRTSRRVLRTLTACSGCSATVLSAAARRR